MQQLKLFSGHSSPALAQEIVGHLEMDMGLANLTTFSDGEIFFKIEESVRGCDVYVVQSFSEPVNTHIMELLIMVDAFRRASAKEITAVIPYYGYARQDRKDQPRVPITAKLVADLLTTAGIDRVVTVDLHAGQIQGFFNVPVDHLYATPVLLDAFRKMELKNFMVVSPDAGGVERARAFAKRMEADMAIVDKRREGHNKTKVMNIIGDVSGRDILILDDMIDTAGTLTQAVSAIKEAGAGKVFAACTHAVLSGPALQRLNESSVDGIIVTDTVPLKGKEITCPKISVFSVAPLLAKTIRRIHQGGSVASLFV